jgi:hypothetical protein
MTLGDWNDFMEHDEAEQERLHREALACYERWVQDRKRRDAAYDAAVAAYHATLRTPLRGTALAA